MSDERARAAQGYLEAKIRTASPAELISILYEALARELRLASASVDRGDRAARGVAVGRALGIIGELRTSINHETGGEVATNFERLYTYWTRNLIEANAGSSRAPIERVSAQLESIRTAWNQALLHAPPGAPLVAAAADRPSSVAVSPVAGGAASARPGGREASAGRTREPLQAAAAAAAPAGDPGRRR